MREVAVRWEIRVSLQAPRVEVCTRLTRDDDRANDAWQDLRTAENEELGREVSEGDEVGEEGHVVDTRRGYEYSNERSHFFETHGFELML
jgi:hypothetical protein